MAGAHILSSMETQRTIAGMTRSGVETAAPAPPVFTVPEFLNFAQVRSELEHMTAGGFHPENVLLPVSRAIENTIDGTPGRYGGLVPSLQGHAAPGPAGESLAARGRKALSRAEAFLRRL